MAEPAVVKVTKDFEAAVRVLANNLEGISNSLGDLGRHLQKQQTSNVGSIGGRSGIASIEGLKNMEEANRLVNGLTESTRSLVHTAPAVQRPQGPQ